MCESRWWERGGRELKGVRGIIQPKDGVLPETQGGMRGQQCSSTASISHPCDPLHTLWQSLHGKTLVFHVCTNLNIVLRKCITNLTVISPSGLQVYCVEGHNCQSPVACFLKQVSSRSVMPARKENLCTVPKRTRMYLRFSLQVWPRQTGEHVFTPTSPARSWQWCILFFLL